MRGFGVWIPALIDVANALGMTGMQRLLKVELPLAASVILAGLRTATVTCVGVATIAAAIGAGGLGELIFRGVASVDNGLVLAGAVPAALLALWRTACWGSRRSGWRCGGKWERTEGSVRKIVGTLVFIVALLCGQSKAAEKWKPNPADYTVKVHVSTSRYEREVYNALYQILEVMIDGRHYDLYGPTSSARAYLSGNGLLNPGDYMAMLITDVHKTPFESLQMYEVLLPDNTVRRFGVISG